jgi:hypothetical protein
MSANLSRNNVKVLGQGPLNEAPEHHGSNGARIPAPIFMLIEGIGTGSEGHQNEAGRSSACR